MPGDSRVNQLMDHTEAMIDLLELIEKDALEKAERVRNQANPHGETIAFLEDFAERAHIMGELLEEDILARIIGLNNLAGPVQHLLDAHASDK